MISCPLCKKLFKSSFNLQDHMVTHTKEKPHKCHICSAAFGTKSSLIQHVKSIHDGIKKIQSKTCQCPLCSLKCCSQSKLQKHMRTHSAEQPFPCSISGCGFKTKYENYLRQHFRFVHTNKRPYKCPSDGCNYNAKIRTSLKNHLKTHYNEKPFACQFPGCSYTCKFKTKLTIHTSTVHSDVRPFKCSTCYFRAKSKSYLSKHIKTHDKVKRFQCRAPSCRYACHRKDTLKMHFHRKHEKQDVLCTAPGCNFRCRAFTLLKAHLKRHENPMLNCPSDSGNVRSTFKRTLLSHISLRHKGFPSGAMEEYQRHYPSSVDEARVHCRFDRHGIAHNAEAKRKYACTFCFSEFRESWGLQEHLQRHIGEKPHRCYHCTYTSSLSRELKAHARRVHSIYATPRGKEDQVRKCRTCGVIFWSKSELLLHSMSHLQPIVVLKQLTLKIM